MSDKRRRKQAKDSNSRGGGGERGVVGVHFPPGQGLLEAA